MLALPELQRLFWRALDGQDVDPALLRAIAPSAPLTAEQRIGIYADMYVTRLVETLQEDFPRLAALAGQERFAALVRAYVARHPSTDPSVGRLGASMAAFLAAGGAPDLPPWASDLARLEWARRDVVEAPEVEPLALATLRALEPEAWPELRFAVVPACTTLVVAWPVHEAWAAEAAPPPEIVPARTVLRIWRHRFLVYHAPMDGPEEEAFARLASGRTFAEICDGFDRPEAAAGLLLRWIEDGIVAPAAGGDPSPWAHS